MPLAANRPLARRVSYAIYNLDGADDRARRQIVWIDFKLQRLVALNL